MQNNKTSNTNPLVCFIGLPSAGKSTLINSIIGKRMLESGVCRTTTNVFYIGTDNKFSFNNDRYKKADLLSDDGHVFDALDLPGVADAENNKNSTNDNNFCELTKKWVVNCDVIYWVSDIINAFITQHELDEYNKIKKLLEEETRSTGKLYQLAILLSKYGYEDPNPSEKIVAHAKNKNKKYDESGELISDTEDTTATDCVNRVNKIFKNDEKIIKFNAYGRILHNPKCSENMRKFYINNGGIGSKNINTKFELGWALEKVYQKQQFSYLNSLINNYFTIYKDVKTDNNWKQNIKTIYDKINDVKILGMLMEFAIIHDSNTLNSFKLKYPDLYTVGSYHEQWWTTFFESLVTSKDSNNKLDNILMTSYNDIVVEIPNKEIFNRLSKIVSCQNITLTRLYFNLIKKGKMEKHSKGQITEGLPIYANYDLAFTENRELSMNKSWVMEIKQKREKLWGNQDHVYFPMLFVNVWNGTFPSLFCKID